MAEAFCPVYAALNLLQEKWTLHIIRALLEGPKGFNELSRAVGGVNPATLSQRLDQLVRLGVVEKRVESYMPPRTRYSLTPAGEEAHEEEEVEQASRDRLEAGSLLLLMRLLARAALAREESRGAHFREDFPLEDRPRHSLFQGWRLGFLPVGVE